MRETCSLCAYFETGLCARDMQPQIVDLHIGALQLIVLDKGKVKSLQAQSIIASCLDLVAGSPAQVLPNLKHHRLLFGIA